MTDNEFKHTLFMQELYKICKDFGWDRGNPVVYHTKNEKEEKYTVRLTLKKIIKKSLKIIG